MQSALRRTIEDPFITHFGMSSDQFRRELEADFERATPEERAEFEQIVEQANTVLPEMNATLDRMSDTAAKMSAMIGEVTACIASIDARVSRIEDGLLNKTTATHSSFE
jgi:hypothetical protein